MVNLILSTAATHFQAYFESRKEFRLLSLGKNKDGKNVFPDGEVFVKLSDLPKAGRIIVLHSGAPNPNDGLAELEMILSILKREGKTDVEVFFSYFPYSMQDKMQGTGETIAAEDVLRKLVSYYGVKKVYAIDPHFHDAPWLSGLPFVPVSAHEMLVTQIRVEYPDAVFVAPDMGHTKRVKGLKGVQKTRLDSYTIHLAEDEALFNGLKNKVVAVVDDLVETGGTMIRFQEACKKYGSKEMVAVVTHGLLPEGVKRLQNNYSKLFLSNSIAEPASNIDIAPLVEKALIA
ncbi:MAG: ribose-phosphate diphosphokinase [bacterium]|nr:ribose-phosphate diphosphokinase [bacterium]